MIRRKLIKQRNTERQIKDRRKPMSETNENIPWKMEIIKKSQTEILEMKSSISVITFTTDLTAD